MHCWDQRRQRCRQNQFLVDRADTVRACYSAPVGVLSIVINPSVCLSVCLSVWTFVWMLTQMQLETNRNRCTQKRREVFSLYRLFGRD